VSFGKLRKVPCHSFFVVVFEIVDLLLLSGEKFAVVRQILVQAGGACFASSDDQVGWDMMVFGFACA
jgi:hypothetical protein